MARVQIATATLSGNSLRQTVHTRRASVRRAAKLVAALLRVAGVHWRKVRAAYRRVYDSRHLQADCQEPGSAPGPYARQSSVGYLAEWLVTFSPTYRPVNSPIISLFVGDAGGCCVQGRQRRRRRPLARRRRHCRTTCTLPCWCSNRTRSRSPCPTCAESCVLRRGTRPRCANEVVPTIRRFTRLSRAPACSLCADRVCSGKHKAAVWCLSV